MNNPAGSEPVPPMACYRFDADLRVYRCEATYSHWIKTFSFPLDSGACNTDGNLVSNI
jgi:hypothetical protein